MAFFSDLVRAIAAAEGMDEMTVSGIGQYLRKAGLISKSGRGTSAARMTNRDAANLLIAVNGTGAAKDAVTAVEHFRDLATKAQVLVGADTLWSEMTVGRGAFGVALERLLDASTRDATGVSRIERTLSSISSKSFKREGLRALERRNIEIIPAFLEIELRRPVEYAEVRVMRPYFNNGSGRIQFTETNELEFSGAKPIEDAPDRRDVTVITQRTLIAVATTLHS